MADNPTPQQIKLPDISAWQKAMPYILALASAVLAAVGTGNWMNVGKAALDNIPNIFLTLGLTSGGILSAIATIWTALQNNQKTNSIIDRLKSDVGTLSGQVDSGQLQPFLDQLRAGIASNPNVPAMTLPGFALSVDPATFGYPTADSRKLIVASVDAFLANLEKKAVVQ